MPRARDVAGSDSRRRWTEAAQRGNSASGEGDTNMSDPGSRYFDYGGVLYIRKPPCGTGGDDATPYYVNGEEPAVPSATVLKFPERKRPPQDSATAPAGG